jgi:acyl-CoA thioesterase FadM
MSASIAKPRSIYARVSASCVLLSANHWNALATAAMQESTNWFLGAQSIEYYKEVKLAETITATTFIEKIERQKCFRKVIPS